MKIKNCLNFTNFSLMYEKKGLLYHVSYHNSVNFMKVRTSSTILGIILKKSATLSQTGYLASISLMKEAFVQSGFFGFKHSKSSKRAKSRQLSKCFPNRNGCVVLTMPLLSLYVGSVHCLADLHYD